MSIRTEQRIDIVRPYVVMITMYNQTIIIIEDKELKNLIKMTLTLAYIHSATTTKSLGYNVEFHEKKSRLTFVCINM